MRRLVLVLALTASACADYPQLEAAVSPQARAADYPAILPLGALLARQSAATTAIDLAGPLPARAAALRRRARALSAAPVVDAATRARMQAALARRS